MITLADKLSDHIIMNVSQVKKHCIYNEINTKNSKHKTIYGD